MERAVLFLDDGGVMNDNVRRGRQWQQLVAQFFAPRLGGAPDGWAAANHAVAMRLFEDYLRTVHPCPDVDYLAWLDGYRREWTRGMCEFVGIAAPSADDCRRLADEATDYVTPRVRATFPGAVAAIRALHDSGDVLYTASGEQQRELHGYLTGMGVRDCFRALYGPDLVNTPKAGVAYYERLFAHAGVAPDAAVVVDDSLISLGWARAAGAFTVHVRSERREEGEAGLSLSSLAELPSALAGLLGARR